MKIKNKLTLIVLFSTLTITIIGSVLGMIEYSWDLTPVYIWNVIIVGVTVLLAQIPIQSLK